MTGRRGDTAKLLPATHNYTHRWRCIDCHPESALIREALTSEDEIAHGEAVFERDGALVRTGHCAYCDDDWPCRTQRGIDRLLVALAKTSEP